MISMALSLHGAFIVLMLLLLAWMLWTIKSQERFEKNSRKYEAISLYHRATLGALFFTGLVVMAVLHFHVAWSAYLMVIVILHMSATSIKESLLYKKTRFKDATSLATFHQYIWKKYRIDAVLLIVMTGVAYAVSLS